MNFPVSNEKWSREDLGRLALCLLSDLVGMQSSYDSINTSDALLYSANLKQILERLDYLLKPGGALIISCPDFSDNPHAGRRTGTQIQYELSILFPECYVLHEKKNGEMRYRKIQYGRMHKQGRISVTLGYITDGRDVNMIMRTLVDLTSVTAVDVAAVLIAGPAETAEKLSKIYPKLRHVGDFCHEDVRPPINKKKALIIDATKTDNLILAHDRFYFDIHFWERLGLNGNHFDFYNCRHCLDSASSADVNVVGAYGEHRSPISAYSFSVRSNSCDFSLTNPHFYNNGGLYVAKTNWFRGGRWPLHLHWGDLEDVHFTRRCELDGAIWRNDWGNRVYTTNKRLSLVKKRRIDQQIRSFIFDTFKAVIFWIKNGELEIR